jgi:hypothetical protein
MKNHEKQLSYTNDYAVGLQDVGARYLSSDLIQSWTALYSYSNIAIGVVNMFTKVYSNVGLMYRMKPRYALQYIL